MSIKKLFDSTNKSRNYLSDTDEKSAFESVESDRNVRAVKTKQDTFVPQIDYSDPVNFAKYGSAYLYYKSAMEHIYDYYPYDGSDAEINEYYNKLLDIEKYVFNNLYPRTNGLVHLSVGGWGTLSSTNNGYGLPSTLEYITFFGGPNTSSYSTLADAFPNPNDTRREYSNIYDTDIYTTAGLPADYASGSRESNLKSNFDYGVTVEFWLQKSAFLTASTEKEVVFDMWNSAVSGTTQYGRLRVELSGAASGSPFLLTALSGTSGIYQQSIGTSITTGSLATFSHYAVSFYNSGSSFVTKLYVNGELNDTNTTAGTISELESQNMAGRIGALLGATAGPLGPSGSAGAGKLSGSLDEFRFWKATRESNNIGLYWNTQVRGGTNTDISNATLGIYYKFNEGISTDTNIDSRILDYSGRISNGSWVGYTTNSRATSSAIVLAGAATTEYRDPIIYSTHPTVASLETSLLNKGTYHDANNNGAFVNLMPSWILEESESETTDLRLVSHIVATYFDKLALQIAAVPKFKHPSYTSASATPLPFARHLPQSLGLFTPELFVDSTVLEKFLNRTPNIFMESDLEETKNLIYLNLYNSLTGIYKAKGTQKAIKNVLRCFNLDDTVIKLKTYADGQIYPLQNNLQLTLLPNSSVNFNTNANLQGVVFQRSDSSNAESFAFISGTYSENKEDRYGFTVETNVIFPQFERRDEAVNRGFQDISLFGMALANTSSVNDTTWAATDPVNFQVYAVRDELWSKNVYFKLTSSITPFPFPVLTSSTYLSVYNNEEWNFSVRLKPSNYPLADMVGGSSTFTYDLEFRGVNTISNMVQNNFLLTASISQAVGSSILQTAKRLYAGARRINITGAIQAQSDVLFTDMKYWTQYLEYDNITQHAYNINNAGISGSYKNISALDSNLLQTDALNSNALALHWTFANVTGSDSGGDFYYVQDMSSGSALLRDNYGWPGAIAGSQHTGYGYGFKASSTDAIKKELTNVMKFVDPESPVSSDMINVLGDDEVVYGIAEARPNFFHVVEKSMYNAISEEMLLFFAGVIDFNNIIGEPVNRYRARYKTLEKLREIFFRKVSQVSSVEKFIDYYKWLDDAIATIIAQLIPASAGFAEDAYNIIESHVLERNKYKTQFPTIEFKPSEPETPIMGINEKLYNWRINHAPLSNKQNENTPWWRERANRLFNARITSGDTDINRQRENIRQTAHVVNNQTSSTVSTVNKVEYQTSVDVLRTRALPYRMVINRSNMIKGGVNFEDNKNIALTYNSLMPAGPVNRDNSVFVPMNVLLALASSINALPDSADITNPSKKIKRYFSVQAGRDWQDGVGYSNLKSSFIFPFNVMSSSVTTGYNKAVVEKVTGNIEITNLHNDVYGPQMEKPMQGPFTDYAVGGHQSRHVKLNRGADNYTNRPEAWKLLLGTCNSVFPISGAIGMAGPDYPWPEANEEGALPYPMTASQKAVYYRGMIAKSPVNIRNIHCTTGSATLKTTILGNYRQMYQVVNSVGAYQNPRGFVESPPTLPARIVTGALSPTQARSILDIRRTAESHFEFVPDYSIGYYTASSNKTIIRSRFSAPGGIETIGQGYGDIRSDEYSVYNARNYRNWTVLRPFQNMGSGTVSQATGSGTPGIRVYDIHGNDFGLISQLTRHAGRFGRDSVLVTNPGALYNQLPSYIKINRNPRHRLIITGKEAIMGGPSLTNSSSINYAASNGSCLVLTGAAGWDAGNTLFNAVTSSGISYSGWVWFAGTAVSYFFRVGRTQGNSFPAFNLFKNYSSAEHRINIEVATQDASTGGTEQLAQWYISGAATEQWHHVAVTWSGSNWGLASVQPTVYLNGVSASLITDTAPSAFYQDDWRSLFTFKAWSGTPYVGFEGDQFVVFGGNHNNYAFEFTGSMDEMSIWKRPLSGSEVTELYNGGVPCDVTASTAYLSDTSALFDWIRCGGGPGADAIDSGNPGALNSTNRVNGFIHSGTTAYLPIAKEGDANTLAVNTSHPVPLAGCSSTVVGFKNTYASASQFDNYWVQHQIPRADRQYSWITGALAPEALNGGLRYYGFAPLTGPQAGYYEYSASAGRRYTAYFEFVSASAVLGKAGTASIYQPALDLNIYIRDPVDPDGDNIQGLALDSLNVGYYNGTLLDVYSILPNLNIKSDYFNLLMTKRKSTFGYRGVPQTGPIQSPILRKHSRENTFTFTTTVGSPQRYTIKPHTDRGRPILMNLDVNEIDDEGSINSTENVTLKVPYGNEKIYFSNTTLNETFFNEEETSKDLVFDQLTTLANTSDKYTLKWVLYSEMLFPTKEKEYTSGSSTRVGYNNLYWRHTQLERYLLHNTSIATNSYGVSCEQTSWPLDAPLGFLTRSITGVPFIGSANNFLLKQSNSAGELQNEYLHAVPGTPSVATKLIQSRNAGVSGLYARKHMLGGARSLVSPSGIPIPQTGSVVVRPTVTNPGALFGTQSLFTGEAVWEAPTQAGIITKSPLGLSSFVSHSSDPWFSNYADFEQKLGIVSKGYAIVPEFRISEHVEDYEKYGINANNKYDTFEIVGTTKDSAQSNFYNDYSNTEFMKGFLNIQDETYLEPSEIMLVCSASIRFNPYKGFYPAQRTLQLINRFKLSYGGAILGQVATITLAGVTDGPARPLAEALFAPGLLYNTIKSGLAVDYPIITTRDKFVKQYYGDDYNTVQAAGGIVSTASAWMVTSDLTSAAGGGFDVGILGYQGGEIWDYRIPFEAIVEPEKYITNINFFDMEPHPSASLGGTASFSPVATDTLYSKMSSNFFGEIGNFFLKDAGYTRLESNVVTADLKFKSGSIYGARLKLRRSMSGSRIYNIESGSTANSKPFGTYGGKLYDPDASVTRFKQGAVYPLPQDPNNLPPGNFQESFTMYSRATAFGPPIAGRPRHGMATSSNVLLTRPMDSVAGYNWAYTPPYYNGECWFDIIFEPNLGETYDLEKILSEVKTVSWRADPGPSASLSGNIQTDTDYNGTQFIPTFSGNIAGVGDLIYDGKNVNANAMQLSASINCFGIERVLKTRVDKFGNEILSEDETAGMKWVIQPKMETPMANFNNLGAHPITNAASNLSIPTYAPATVPRGMWHQFGIIEPHPGKGIFLEIGDIPKDWLRYHYDVISNNSIYNKNDASTYGTKMSKEMEPLSNVVKFNTANSSKKLGQLAESVTIKEAIVAIPYQQPSTAVTTTTLPTDFSVASKTFFEIDKAMIEASLNPAIGSKDGDSLEFAGLSIRQMVETMQQYILPPQFDFLNNASVDPMVMYFFEFEYTFDQDDLNYIWQNLAPRGYKKITKTAQSTAHLLADNELMNKEDITNPETRWMVFKVKQRSQTAYSDLISSQVGESANPDEILSTVASAAKTAADLTEDTYSINYNWPYDYVSFVESVKFEARALYKTSSVEEVLTINGEINGLPAALASAISTTTNKTTKSLQSLSSKGKLSSTLFNSAVGASKSGILEKVTESLSTEGELTSTVRSKTSGGRRGIGTSAASDTAADATPAPTSAGRGTSKY